MKTVIHPEYNHLASFILTLPDRFDLEGKIIHEGRNILKVFEVGQTRLVVKRFKKPHLINRVAYTYFRKSKACRSYTHAQEILRRGFLSPAPVAFLENKSGGLLTDSYYVSIYEGDTSTVRDIMGGQVKGNESFLSQFAHFAVRLHQAGIIHMDFSPGNILFKQEEEGNYTFSLVDINRLTFGEVSSEKACMNLRRLCTSREVLSYIARAYAKDRGWDEQDTDHRISACSDDFFVRYMYHLAAKAWIRSGKSVWKNPVGKYRRYDRLSHCSCLPASVRNRMLEKAGTVYFTYLAEWDFRQVYKNKFRLPE